MNTSFHFLEKSLQLYRYPRRFAHPSWQAWDAADELILEHIHQEQGDITQASIVIMNDDFGALSCWLNEADIHHVSDSLVAQIACQHNIRENELDKTRIKFHDSLAQIPQAPDWVIIKIPKTLALLEHQLIQLQSVLAPTTRIVAGAKAKAIQKSTLALFEKYLGKTHTSLAKKKARLIFCEPELPLTQQISPYPTTWEMDQEPFTILNHANVFARQQIDIGARMLIDNLPNCNGKIVVDLGCGNGVVGLCVLKRFADAQVIFVDESYMAVESARQNVKNNLPDQFNRAQFVVSNCLERLEKQQQIDIVICNPPFHQLNTITDHIATQMFEDACSKLAKGGELRVIGNRHLDYPQKLKRLFGGYSVVASDRKFSILSSLK
ncbi:methyltransferase [Aliiglaciecola lipolytica]|uniref:Ribosomal RNA large subunit methyltransferase G n=1 Tax=Aliiglaciecola lipolytica E3 TaxID=1127673 RepID=K6YJZ1_9ALTE|nr:methyltransferase [Aliiglaciecola lipolytica]GAC16928.1 23S rRNA (guanine1835-N2)-methyltransferase [Aliiglaciecola lipolytica E3]